MVLKQPNILKQVYKNEGNKTAELLESMYYRMVIVEKI